MDASRWSTVLRGVPRVGRDGWRAARGVRTAPLADRVVARRRAGLAVLRGCLVTAAHDRGAALEEAVARLVHGARVKGRPRYLGGPDVWAIALPCGRLIQLEAKHRKAIPAYVREGLVQCRRYSPDAVPCVVIREYRGEMIACLPLADFAELVGLRPQTLPAQGTIAFGGVS